MARKKIDPELIVLDQFATLPLERADLLLKFCVKIVGDRKPPQQATSPRKAGRPRKINHAPAIPEV